MDRLPCVDPGLLRRTLEGFLAEELRASGLDGFVLGLSGGVDSAVVAAIAAAAVGTKRVHCLAIPGPTSSRESLDHARLVADFLSLTLEVVDLSAVAAQLAGDLGAREDRLRFGNIMARLRMIALFDHARCHGLLVAGTSNKSEILLGYSTLFGDSACSANPIGDVWKTHIFELARHLGIPDVVAAKPPTADLWPGQTDAGELGFDYLEADPILYRHHELGLSQSEIVASGCAAELVAAVLAAYRRNRFKWRPTVVARVSSSAINVDRILPRNPRPHG